MIGKIYSPLIFFEKKILDTESFMDNDLGSLINSYFWGKIPGYEQRKAKWSVATKWWEANDRESSLSCDGVTEL